MANTKEQTVDSQIKELFEYLLKKTGVKKKDLVDLMMRDFIQGNIYEIPEDIKKKYTQNSLKLI